MVVLITTNNIQRKKKNINNITSNLLNVNSDIQFKINKEQQVDLEDL